MKRRVVSFFLLFVFSLFLAVIPSPANATVSGGFGYLRDAFNDARDAAGGAGSGARDTLNDRFSDGADWLGDQWCRFTGFCPEGSSYPPLDENPSDPSDNPTGFGCPDLSYEVAATLTVPDDPDTTRDESHESTTLLTVPGGSTWRSASEHGVFWGFNTPSGSFISTGSTYVADGRSMTYAVVSRSDGSPIGTPCSDGSPENPPGGDDGGTDPPDSGGDPPGGDPPGGDPPGGDPPGGGGDPPPGDGDPSNDLPQSMSCADLEFPDLLATLALFEDKFPFGALEFAPSGAPSQCMTLSYLGQEYEMCALRDLLAGAKWIVWIVYLAKVVLYL